jgi:hypothetical protein
MSMLPDVLPYDPKKAAAYPGNGRMPMNGSVDTFLTVFNDREIWDKCGQNTDLMDEFPYLDPAQPEDL